jgi:hypothetical protein
MRSIGHPDYQYRPWDIERKLAARARAKARWNANEQWRASKYDGDREWPEGVRSDAEQAPAIAWIQCIMPELRKDAEIISEHDEGYSIYHAMLVLLVIIRRRKADVPFICTVTGMDYNDVLVMVVRAKLGWIVLDDDQPNMGLFSGDDAEMHVAALLAAMLMAGIMRHNLDAKWFLGDQSDLDGNAAQHMLQDVLHARSSVTNNLDYTITAA